MTILVNFLNWHNPLELNSRQVRIVIIFVHCLLMGFRPWQNGLLGSLPFSSSIPSSCSPLMAGSLWVCRPQFRDCVSSLKICCPRRISVRDPLRVNGVNTEILFLVSAAPHNSDMTDGCGYVNHAALMALRMRFEWNTFPTAIQCRLGGSKVSSIVL